MAFTRSQLCVGIVLYLCAATAWAQHKLDDARRVQLKSAVSKFMAQSGVPAISVGVVEGGEEIWAEGFGMADLENFVPATPQTLYRLASISKSLTATGAMQLGERQT
jgi:CubicO group peptidase (beta-lactamase class C family)